MPRGRQPRRPGTHDNDALPGRRVLGGEGLRGGSPDTRRVPIQELGHDAPDSELVIRQIAAELGLEGAAHLLLARGLEVDRAQKAQDVLPEPGHGQPTILFGGGSRGRGGGGGRRGAEGVVARGPNVDAPKVSKENADVASESGVGRHNLGCSSPGTKRGWSGCWRRGWPRRRGSPA